MKSSVYLSLGSNICDREKNLTDAIFKIQNIDEIDVEKVSDIFETSPVGYEEQRNFLNLAVKLFTTLEPYILLKTFKQIENDMGRTTNLRWGPRIIDIDILLYQGITINSPELTIPHPKMFERAFVLIPLKQIYDEVESLNLDNLQKMCDDKQIVKLYRKSITLKKK